MTNRKLRGEVVMPWLAADPVIVLPAHREALEALVRAHSTSQQLALRARMILHAADNIGVRESARELDVWPKTVRYWRGRWRQAPAATVRANTAPSSATRRVPARSRGRQYCRRHAKSCELATPTVVRSNGLAPALPALHGAQAKQSPDRRPARASRLPLSASDSSCHGAADSTPVLLPESSLAQTTFVPP